jgi:hypothetical protein
MSGVFQPIFHEIDRCNFLVNPPIWESCTVSKPHGLIVHRAFGFFLPGLHEFLCLPIIGDGASKDLSLPRRDRAVNQLVRTSSGCSK